VAFVNNFLPPGQTLAEVLAFEKQIVLLVARFRVPKGRPTH
jgi:hypothetical protein